jgi:hypothetical protein
VSGVERLLIDGNNLLHRLSGGVDDQQQRTLLARLRGVLPGVRKTIVFDGRRMGAGAVSPATAEIDVIYAGRSADDVLVELVRALPATEVVHTILVTDDRALADRARHAGAASRRLDWLVSLLQPAGSPVHPSDRQRPGERADESDDDERRPWQPGRGATRKKGNPRRAARSQRRRTQND